MTKTGHTLTAGALSVALGSMISGGYIDYFSIDNIDHIYIIGILVSGIMFGASAPDWMEMVKHVGNKRISLIPHRTLTHWPPLWLGLAFYLYWYHPLPWYGQLFATGFIISSLLHIMMDAFSKSGIPILLPFASFRWRIPLYTTGKFSETLMATAVIIFFSTIIYIAPLAL
jgi:membrane-bound metal-dependent hydrolase YbcI (DUF457 family)